MQGFCEKCNKWMSGSLKRKKEKFEVREDLFELEIDILCCDKCDAEMYCEELDAASQLKVFDEYKKKHKLLTSEQIKEIREKYKLSQRALGKLLNWGDKTVWRYEQGSVQDKTHNAMLLYISSPINLKEYLNNNQTKLGEAATEKLNKLLDSLIEQKYDSGLFAEAVTYAYIPWEKDDFNLNYEKFANTVLYFANQEDPMLKVKQMKLLYYSDNAHFKKHNESITGSQYIHYKYGPVPAYYEQLLAQMINDELINIDVIFNGNYEMHLIWAQAKPNLALFNKDEINTMEHVHNTFKNFGSAKLMRYSHEEEGYKRTKPGEIIPYKYARNLSI